MEKPSYQYVPSTNCIVLEGTNEPVAQRVTPAHGLLLAASPLFREGCVQIERMLGNENVSPEERVEVCQDLLSVLLEDYEREQIRMLPEVA
jgi:hypothetical protein